MDFAKGKGRLQMVLQRQIYTPSDTIHGDVNLTILANIELTAIRVETIGKERSRAQKKSFVHFSQLDTLYGHTAASGRKTGAYLQAGTYTYPFAVALPPTVPPSFAYGSSSPSFSASASASSSGGGVEYVVRAHVVLPSGPTMTLEVPLLVLPAAVQRQAALSQLPSSLGGQKTHPTSKKMFGLVKAERKRETVEVSAEIAPRLVVLPRLRPECAAFLGSCTTREVEDISGGGVTVSGSFVNASFATPGTAAAAASLSAAVAAAAAATATTAVTASSSSGAGVMEAVPVTSKDAEESMATAIPPSATKYVPPFTVTSGESAVGGGDGEGSASAVPETSLFVHDIYASLQGVPPLPPLRVPLLLGAPPLVKVRLFIHNNTLRHVLESLLVRLEMTCRQTDDRDGSGETVVGLQKALFDIDGTQEKGLRPGQSMIADATLTLPRALRLTRAADKHGSPGGSLRRGRSRSRSRSRNPRPSQHTNNSSHNNHNTSRPPNCHVDANKAAPAPRGRRAGEPDTATAPRAASSGAPAAASAANNNNNNNSKEEEEASDDPLDAAPLVTIATPLVDISTRLVIEFPGAGAKPLVFTDVLHLVARIVEDRAFLEFTPKAGQPPLPDDLMRYYTSASLSRPPVYAQERKGLDKVF